MYQKPPIVVAVSGAAGQICYSLLPRIASGEMFGLDQPVRLQLLDIESSMKSLSGLLLELEDCAYPLLASVMVTSDVNVAFQNASWVLLIGGMPRKQGMERKDLLAANAGIFAPQGAAIQKHAATDVRILVVANPCNTNCLIAREAAKDIPHTRWFAMTRLDENRAKAQLAWKARVSVSSVTRMAIWGNHSSTQYPDAYNALIDGKPCHEVIRDPAWIEGDFIKMVQQRGAEVIKARGFSSAASAANAVIDSIKSIHLPTPEGDSASLAVASSGQYEVPVGLQFGFPIRTDGKGWWVPEGIQHTSFARERLKLTIQELVEERAEVANLLRA